MPVKSKARRSTASTPGQQMIEELQELLATLQEGGMDAVKAKYKVHELRPVFPAVAWTATEVVAVREQVGVSRVEFAALLGVTANTVRGWEEGTKAPTRIASRFLDEVRADPEHWRKRLAAVRKPVR